MTTVTITEQSVNVVTVGTQGPEGPQGNQGDQGPQGNDGAPGSTDHTQLSNLDFNSSGHTGFAGVDVNNTFSVTQYFTDSPGTLGGLITGLTGDNPDAYSGYSSASTPVYDGSAGFCYSLNLQTLLDKSQTQVAATYSLGSLGSLAYASNVSLSSIASGTSGRIAYATSASAHGSAAALNYATSGTHLNITSQGSTIRNLALTMAASQSVNPFEVRNSSNTVLSGVLPAGGLFVASQAGNQSAPLVARAVSGASPEPIYYIGVQGFDSVAIGFRSNGFPQFVGGISFNSSGDFSVGHTAYPYGMQRSISQGFYLGGDSEPGQTHYTFDGRNQTHANCLFQAATNTTNSQAIASTRYTWADNTHASRKGRVTYLAWDATATREYMRGESSGSAPMIGFYGSSAVAKQTITGSRGSNAALADLLTKLATLGLITDSTT